MRNSRESSYEDFPGLRELDAELRADMGAVYAVQTPPAHLSAAIDRAVREREQRRAAPRRGWLPAISWRTRRLATVAALVIALIISAFAAYALREETKLVLLYADPGLQHIMAENLGRDVNVSRRAGDYTLNIGRVYANSNRIFVTYTMDRDGRGSEAQLVQPTLSVRGGPELPLVLSLTVQREGIEGGAVGGEADLVGQGLAFAADKVKGTPKVLKLRLRATAIASDGDNRTNLPEEVVADFKVPFERGHVTHVGKSARVGDDTVTLERVVATRTETRVYVRGLTTPHLVGLASPGVELSTKDWSSNEKLTDEDWLDGRQSLGSYGPEPVHYWRKADGTVAFEFTTAPAGYRGEWTLKVSPLDGSTGKPAVFRFETP